MSEQATVGNGRLLSLEEFALAIGKSARTVSRYVRQGRLMTVTVSDMGRSALRIPEAELAKVSVLHDGQPVEDDGHDDSLMADTNGCLQSDGRHVADINEQAPSLVGQMAANLSDKPVGYVSAAEMLVRYEAAAMRLGWVEGQLDMTRRMLTDGGQQQAEMQARLEAEREGRVCAEREAAAAADVRHRAEAAERRERELAAELEATRARLAVLEEEKKRPWWRRTLW